MRKLVITQNKFGKLTILKEVRSNKGLNLWECKCDCGNIKTARASHIFNGYIKSCGCIKKGTHTHGLSKTRIWNIWMGMKARCLNANEPAYKHYGGRGITVCKRWMKFENFYEDMVTSYAPNLSLDRINVNGNYNKSNCRWATRTQQANNTRSNKYLTYKGRTQNLSEWAKEIGVNYHTLYGRIYAYKMPIEKALVANKNYAGRPFLINLLCK